MVEILISTMNNNIFKNKKLLSSKYEKIIINQITNSSIEPIRNNHIYNLYEKGLSKSRNRAIGLAKGDICLIADDDIYYKNNIEDIILKVYKDNPDIDIITFQIETPEGKDYKKYSNTQYLHNIKTIFKVSSIEITFRRKSIKDSYLKFDEKFGLGSYFKSGEEAIFLSDALNRGLKLLYLPIPIVYHPYESSGKVFDDDSIISKGAMLYRIFGYKAYIVSILFVLKKYKLYDKSIFDFYRLMLKGIKSYKRVINAK